MHTWTIAAALCIPVTVFFQGKPLIEMWPWFDGDLGLWLSCTLQTVIVYPMAFPVYAVSIYIWSVVEALAVLFRIVASQLAEASTYRQIKGVHFPSPRCTVAFVHVQLSPAHNDGNVHEEAEHYCISE
ncbi:Sarcoplasmic/endoplasmic reticulum calcium ATPase 1 [Frankliniella fusca]|uniref:Sarcoplasmic/endoplasmic reticulum calcium ATPase 1 n=1 Tax=Frankliniella fusca TaxID=407009 RepID=A0AAE1LP08_9NEOP|nr:Sarcoplasmic/endoplasmic reticulum calcium ATPase 1 [Frankliniella fusca]